MWHNAHPVLSPKSDFSLLFLTTSNLYECDLLVMVMASGEACVGQEGHCLALHTRCSGGWRWEGILILSFSKSLKCSLVLGGDWLDFLGNKSEGATFSYGQNDS